MCGPSPLQAQNKERAFQILRARLFDLEVQKQQAEIYAKRKMQVRPLGMGPWEDDCALVEAVRGVPYEGPWGGATNPLLEHAPHWKRSWCFL